MYAISCSFLVDRISDTLTAYIAILTTTVPPDWQDKINIDTSRTSNKGLTVLGRILEALSDTPI